MFDFFHDVAEKARAGKCLAQDVMQSWADAEGSPAALKWRRRSP